MLKFGKSLIEYERSLIEFERKRTLLYVSMLKNIKIWFILDSDHKNVLTGIVKSIINGEVKKERFYNYRGEFYLKDETKYPINGIFAISFEEIILNKSVLSTEFNNYCFGSDSLFLPLKGQAIEGIGCLISSPAVYGWGLIGI